MLHGLRAAARADFEEQGFALRAVHARRAQLDQLVGGERALDLGDHGVAQALAADQHDRTEAVRARLERLALGR
jgi:hypothetical protein